MFANREGSHFQAAQCEDERHLAEWEKRFEESERLNSYRPQLAGFDALRAAIHGLRNDIRLVNRLPQLDGPLSPFDKIKLRKREISDRRLDAALGYDNDVEEVS